MTVYTDRTQHTPALLMQEKLTAGVCLCKCTHEDSLLIQVSYSDATPTWSNIGHGIERIPNEGSSFVQCCCAEPLRCTAQHTAHCVAQVIASASFVYKDA